MNASVYVIEPTFTELIFSFNGRISRSKFVALYLGEVLAGTALLFGASQVLAPPLLMLIILPMAWAGFSLAARRWHDLNQSGWWQLIALVPVLGTLVFLRLALAPGDEEGNHYGASPEW